MQPVPAHTTPVSRPSFNSSLSLPTSFISLFPVSNVVPATQSSEFSDFCNSTHLQRRKAHEANGSSDIIAAAFAPHLDDPDPFSIFDSGSLRLTRLYGLRGSIFAGNSPLTEFQFPLPGQLGAI
ncbi:hypothetical protein OUZ56_019702 [Daphnia magna]|uniref:Uncharacterized protein n=1 Tax=Daphnia magna TaxID=35525 RepID=A0ABQ9ZCC9_9CRUS|nr:hypothetical protein OUZ56_019702 [Daphnia magna]